MKLDDILTETITRWKDLPNGKNITNKQFKEKYKLIRGKKISVKGRPATIISVRNDNLSFKFDDDITPHVAPEVLYFDEFNKHDVNLLKEADSNLVITWKQSSPSAVCFFKKIGLKGKDYQDAEVETPDGEQWLVKVDGKRYRIDDNMKNASLMESEQGIGIVIENDRDTGKFEDIYLVDYATQDFIRSGHYANLFKSLINDLREHDLFDDIEKFLAKHLKGVPMEKLDDNWGDFESFKITIYGPITGNKFSNLLTGFEEQFGIKREDW